MPAQFGRHQPMLDAAVAALRLRECWSPFPEIPSGKIYGDCAREEGAAAFARRRERAIASETDAYVRGEWSGETL